MNHCLQAAIDGDPSATDNLIEILRPRITKMAAYYARCCGEDVDDLTQEAWVGLLDALPQLDLGIGSPEQYLIQRARWKLLDAIKYARVRRCIPLEEDIPEHSQVVTGEELHAACVSDFADQLGTIQQAVLGCLLSGLTWRETGNFLGCTSANVAYYVRQIRRRYEEWDTDASCAI